MTNKHEQKNSNQRRVTMAHLGNTSASNRTVLMPSRASAAAVYEPPGPPPTTSTVHSSGIDMFLRLAT